MLTFLEKKHLTKAKIPLPFFLFTTDQSVYLVQTSAVEVVQLAAENFGIPALWGRFVVRWAVLNKSVGLKLL